MTAAQYEFNISRILDAPLAVVWHAWTEKKHLDQWFAPRGCRVVQSELTFEVGGSYQYTLDTGSGITIRGNWSFKEIVFNEKLVFLVSFTDEGGAKIIRYPLQPDWPLEILSTIAFDDLGMKTEVHLSWQAQDASEAERTTFRDSEEVMRMGWADTFDTLNEYLERIGCEGL